MQRKNYFLMPFKSTARKVTSRNGIAMIAAITVLVIISTIMALSLSLTTQTTKRTTDLYLYEQSVLLSQSAAEYALLKISQETPCSIPSVDFRYNSTFDVNITMQYIFTNPSTCKTNSDVDSSGFATVTYANSNGSVLMDITITANPTGTTEPIRYFRRSIQKL